MDPKDIGKLANLLREQGDKLLTSEFKFTLTGDLVRSLNDSFSLIIDEHEIVSPQTFQVTKPNNSKSNVFRELMFIYDFIQKSQVLKLTKFLDDDPLEEDNCVIDISKFRNLTTLEIQRVPIKRILGLQQLRSQLQDIVAERSLTNIKDLIMFCAGDKASGFIWNALKRADFSYNKLEVIDSSLEFTPNLQYLNLSHNKIFQISALVWCPNLKVLNLSFNQLTGIPKLNVESSRRLQSLIINDNLIEDIVGLVRLDALLELDLSGNCMLDHSLLLPLCTLNSLRYLNLSGNPLAFHPKHRSATSRFLSRNAAQGHFQLDGESLSKQEKKTTGSYEHYYPIFGHRMTVSQMTSSSRATPSTKSMSNTPENSSLSSINSLILTQSNTRLDHAPSSSQKRIKPRCVEIEESGVNNKQTGNKSPSGKRLLKEGSKEHLTTKREVEQLRAQYGSDWLYNQGNVVGFEDQNSSRRNLLGELLLASPEQLEESFNNSQPTDKSTPVEETMIVSDGTLYHSVNESTSTYGTARDETINDKVDEEEEIVIFESEDEVVISEAEDNEVQFIVMNEDSGEDLILVVTETNIKEKDAMNGKTLVKWGLSVLESVERPRSNLIRLNFDLTRKDRRERQYRMDVKCCQDLQRILRDYLSSKPLSEMNQTVFKCLKCNSEFSRVLDERKKRDQEIKCPLCGSTFLTKIHKTTKCQTSPPKSSFLAGNSFLPASSGAGFLPKAASSIDIENKFDDGISKTSHSFSSIESAFDSNQSVAGSSVEVLSECSSQASHISQNSQSSIEVLDSNYVSRKPSEERRISQAPSLDTIEDDAMKNEELVHDEALTASAILLKGDELLKPKVVMTIGNVNLTESSSSGSICESVVTAYEHKGKKKDQKPMETSLDGIFKSSSILLSKTPKPKKEIEPSPAQFQPIQYNFDDLSIVDHRIKLHLFQNILEENEEKLMWVVRTLVIEDEVTSSGHPFVSLVVMSTKKLYVLKIVADECEDVGSWLKKSLMNSIDRIEAIREIPSKAGFTFALKSKTNIHLLLQDQNLTDRLRVHINTSNQNLGIDEKLSVTTSQKLWKLTDQNELKYLAVFQSCATFLSSATESDASQEIPKASVDFGCLAVTPEAIHLTTSFQWLCDNISDKMFSNRITLTQPMSNLVELENVTKRTFTLSFMDELENTIEKWRFLFESYPRIRNTLEEVDKIWRKVFCVPLINDDQILS